MGVGHNQGHDLAPIQPHYMEELTVPDLPQNHSPATNILAHVWAKILAALLKHLVTLDKVIAMLRPIAKVENVACKIVTIPNTHPLILLMIAVVSVLTFLSPFFHISSLPYHIFCLFIPMLSDFHVV